MKDTILKIIQEHPDFLTKGLCFVWASYTGPLDKLYHPLYIWLIWLLNVPFRYTKVKIFWFYLFSKIDFWFLVIINHRSMSYIFMTFDDDLIKASSDSHSNCLSCSSCSRLSACSVCKTWPADIWDLADICRLYSSRRSTMFKKRLAKKKKVVQSDLSNYNSTRDGITTLHGSTAGDRPHLGGIFTDVRSIHSLRSPVTGHQAPVIFTRHWSTSHWAPGTGHQSFRHLSGEHQTPVTGHRSVCVSSIGTGHQSFRHQSPGTSHQAPVIRQQTLGSEHPMAICRQHLSSEQSFTNEPPNSGNKQRILLPLEPDFSTMSDPNIVINPPTNTWESNMHTSL